MDLLRRQLLARGADGKQDMQTAGCRHAVMKALTHIELMQDMGLLMGCVVLSLRDVFEKGLVVAGRYSGRPHGVATKIDCA